MIKRAIVRRKIRKTIRGLFGEVKQAHSPLAGVFKKGAYIAPRKVSPDRLPGYRPHHIMVGWWIENDETFRNRIKDEQNAKR